MNEFARQCAETEAYMDSLGLKVVMVDADMARRLRQVGFNMERVKVVPSAIETYAEPVDPLMVAPKAKGPRGRWGSPK